MMGTAPLLPGTACSLVLPVHWFGLFHSPVQFLRSTLLPAAIVLLFALALVAVSARIWLPGDMAAPAPLA
jgi:hypothetical protein